MEVARKPCGRVIHFTHNPGAFCYPSSGRLGSSALGGTMQRRQFITLLSGAATARPLAALAQQGERVRRVGIFSPSGQNNPIVQARLSAFRTGLQALGWIEGRNLRFDYSAAGSEADRLRLAAADLVRLAPDVIVAEPTGLKILQETTREIPIVFVLVLDPVRDGYVVSIAKPEGNLTGFASYDSAIRRAAL
jgi:putative tryptophan/tyrosine transport system substrate-binding protein